MLPFIGTLLLTVLYTIVFGGSYILFDEKTIDVNIIDRVWMDEFRAQVSDVFAEPSVTFSNGSDLVELLRREGINNALTGRPILNEDSPGNVIVENPEGEKWPIIKVGLENGSLCELF